MVRTRVCWDNAAVMSPGTAKKLGIHHGLKVALRRDEAKVELPVYELPGCAPGVVTVAIGYGRNDRRMLDEAALGIAVILREGAAAQSLAAADRSVVADIYGARESAEMKASVCAGDLVEAIRHVASLTLVEEAVLPDAVPAEHAVGGVPGEQGQGRPGLLVGSPEDPRGDEQHDGHADEQLDEREPVLLAALAVLEVSKH